MRILDRRNHWVRTVFLSLFSAFALTAFGSDDPANDFAEATATLEAGDMEAAIQMYEGLLGADWHAPELYHNLAVAYQRQGQAQQALLQAYRAWLLTPFSNAAQANFQSLTESAKLSEAKQKEADRRAAALAWQAPLAWVAASCFWLGVLTLIFIKAAFARGLGFAAIAIGVVTGVATLWIRGQLPPDDGAWIVTAEAAPLRASHGNASPQTGSVPSLGEVRLTAQRGEWFFVETTNGRSGWLASEHVGLLRPWVHRKVD